MDQNGRQKPELEMPDFCRAMVDASPMPMVFVAGDGHVIRYVNPAFCLLVGESKGELIGDSFSHAIPESDECLALLDRVYRTGQAQTHIGQEHSSSHHLYWSYIMWPVVSVYGRRVGIMIQVTETTPFHKQATAMNQALIISSVRQHELTESAETLNALLQAEIVQRKQTEQELERQQREIRASERRYRGLIEAIPQIVWTMTPQGTMDFANSKWFEYLGLTLDAFNQAGWPVLLHPDDKDRSLEAWANGLKSELAFQIEHRLKNVSNDSYRWYLSRAVPIRVEGAEVVKWFGTSTDIEDQKRAELSVFSKQKLESLGILAGGIAHDFNNLLVGILGGASLAADALPVSHDVQEHLSEIIRAGERAAHLTRQMLAYAGKGRFIIEQVDVGELVRSTCSLIKTSIPNSVQLTLQTREDLPPVAADSGQMQQVVMNLVLNAAEAVDESSGGRVTVKTDLLKVSPAGIKRIDLVTGKLAPGTYVVLEIQDSGSGMDETTKAKIFDPFFTTKFTGRGLGLSAVEGILRAQKGALEVKSALGSGSTFRVYLPASSKPGQYRKAAESGTARQGSGTILVVDDEEMVRRTAKLSLENGGFSVWLADGGEEAMRILLSNGKTPISLILLDLSMPGMSGKQVMQQIRVLGIEIPILIASGFSQAEVYKEFSGLDIVGFIQKPFTARQLANCVSGVLHSEQQQKQ